MATNLAIIETQTLTSGSTNPVVISTGSLTNLASTYYVYCASTGSTVYGVQAASAAPSALQVLSGSSVQLGVFSPENFPYIYFPSAGTAYVTLVQVVSEGR